MSQNNPITISSWSLGDQCSLEERIKAAKSAGFEGIGLRAENYVDALDAGLSDADMLALLQKYGMRVTEIEYITEWAEVTRTYEQKYKEQICFHMCDLFGVKHIVPFPVSWTVKMKKKQKETQDILSYHTQAAGCSDKARAKASGGRQPIEECGRTGL